MKVTKKQRKVSGGDLPKDWEIKLDVTVDFTGCPKAQLYDWAFASAWIKIQGRLRKMSTVELEALAKKGYKITWQEVEAKQTTIVIDMRASLLALGLSEEQVEVILANKELAVQMFEKMTKGEEEQAKEQAEEE